VSDRSVTDVPVKLSVIKKEADSVLRQLDTLKQTRPFAFEDLPAIKTAIEKQNAWVSLAPAQLDVTNARNVLANLNREYARIASEPLSKECEALEQKGLNALAEGKYEESIALLKSAVSLQDQINTEFTASPYVNQSRVTRMNRRINELALKPRFEESRAFEVAAVKALEAAEYDKAERLLRDALRLQVSIIATDSQSPFAKISRQEHLSALIGEVKAGREYQQVVDLEAAFKRLLMEGNADVALATIEQMQQVQSRINEIYPMSRYASVQRLEDYEIERQTLLSRPLMDRIEAALVQLKVSLKARNSVLAQQQIQELIRQVDAFTSVYNKSRLLGSEWRQKIQFISLISDRISFFWDIIDRNLKPVPGVADVLLYTREVSQGFYRQIMGENPSARVDDGLPVESVSWEEAVGFCERLSWLTGQSVRLPRLSEYEAATAETTLIQIVEGGWHALNGDKQTHSVASDLPNNLGFYDLFGNVSELTADSDPSDPSKIVVIGGNVRDYPETLIRLPRESYFKNQRNRFTGFRFATSSR
jgi:tetratricopeptide (TPR) repeat protein